MIVNLLNRLVLFDHHSLMVQSIHLDLSLVNVQNDTGFTSEVVQNLEITRAQRNYIFRVDGFDIKQVYEVSRLIPSSITTPN